MSDTEVGTPRSSPVLQRSTRRLALVLACALGSASTSCQEETPPEAIPEDAIVIGAALPFSGPQASTGIHLERALLLAVQDVNRAGGVNGRPLHLKVRDSNSGSDRGAQELKKLLTEDNVDYVVGPEEDHLALALVADIKKSDVLQLLPSFSSPIITDSGTKGAWLRLVPSALTMGCALATKAIEDGTKTTRTIAARDDYHLELASVFASALSTLGGRAYPTVTVASGESSYKKAISQINRYQTDATLMLTYPGTAATIIKEMARSGDVRWYLSPMLHDEALLWNLPKGVLDNSAGISPSLSSDSDCNVELNAGGAGGAGGAASTDALNCSANAANRFADHYTARWDSPPLRASHFYYDAVLMLALGLERARADGLDAPRPQELMPYLTEHAEEADNVAWDSLEEGLELARDGVPIHYVGAAGEYEFNRRGQNLRALVDTWVIDGEHQFADRESVVCRLPITAN